MGQDLNRDLPPKNIQMANKYFERCSATYVIREMQIQIRRHYTLLRMARVQKTDNMQCW